MSCVCVFVWVICLLYDIYVFLIPTHICMLTHASTPLILSLSHTHSLSLTHTHTHTKKCGSHQPPRSVEWPHSLCRRSYHGPEGASPAWLRCWRARRSLCECVCVSVCVSLSVGNLDKNVRVWINTHSYTHTNVLPIITRILNTALPRIVPSPTCVVCIVCECDVSYYTSCVYSHTHTLSHLSDTYSHSLSHTHTLSFVLVPPTWWWTCPCTHSYNTERAHVHTLTTHTLLHTHTLNTLSLSHSYLRLGDESAHEWGGELRCGGSSCHECRSCYVFAVCVCVCVCMCVIKVCVCTCVW
jgi:hypothetical protein